MEEKFWCGEAPAICQVCDREIHGVFVDGKTQWDCWACMCKDCWEMHGEGLGVGLGQMYGRQADGRWRKLDSAGWEPRRETRSWQEIEAEAAFARLERGGIDPTGGYACMEPPNHTVFPRRR